jgi:hypothetical protein
MLYSITNGLQTVTSTGAVPGTLDTSAMLGPFTAKLTVAGLTAGSIAIIGLEDTASETPFSDAIAQAIWQVTGPVSSSAQIDTSLVSEYQIPGCRSGDENSKLRLYVYKLTGSDPSLTVGAEVQQ